MSSSEFHQNGQSWTGVHDHVFCDKEKKLKSRLRGSDVDPSAAWGYGEFLIE